MTIDNNKKQSIIFDGGYKDFNIKPHLPGDKVNSELLKLLIQNLSDKIRSPMFVLKSYAQLLQRTKDQDVLDRGFQLMEAATNRLDQIITSLNTLSEIYTQQLPDSELVFFREALHNAKLNLYEQLKNSDVQFELNFSDQNKIWFPQKFLYEVLLQFISNAVIHNAGRKDLRISISSYKILNNIILEVKDNGKGINLEQMKEKVSSPFNNHSKHANSVGIGLSKVEAIAKVTGSVFDIESSVGIGTVCRFYFRQ